MIQTEYLVAKSNQREVNHVKEDNIHHMVNHIIHGTYVTATVTTTAHQTLSDFYLLTIYHGIIIFPLSIITIIIILSKYFTIDCS